MDPQNIVLLLWNGGWINAASIGFIPGESELNKKNEKSGMDFWDWELLEWSLIPLPSNQDALRQSWEKMFSGDNGMGEMELKPFPNEHACRLRDPEAFQSDSFRRIEREHEGKSYSVIMGKLTGEDTMTEQAYRYPVDDWEPSQAREHCGSHDGSFEVASSAEGISNPDEECFGCKGETTAPATEAVPDNVESNTDTQNPPGSPTLNDDETLSRDVIEQLTQAITQLKEIWK